jgi:hypothetical protein
MKFKTLVVLAISARVITVSVIKASSSISQTIKVLGGVRDRQGAVLTNGAISLFFRAPGIPVDLESAPGLNSA